MGSIDKFAKTMVLYTGYEIDLTKEQLADLIKDIPNAPIRRKTLLKVSDNILNESYVKQCRENGEYMPWYHANDLLKIVSKKYNFKPDNTPDSKIFILPKYRSSQKVENSF